MIIGVDFIRISQYETYPVEPKQTIKTNESEIYWDLVNGDTNVDWERLNGTLEYIESEYDCADFRLVNLIRIIYEFENKIPPAYKKKTEDILFNFRYWLDEPGENSMCYWSENHQILFASAEYLIGKKYANTIFPNSGLTGREHKEKAKVRILDWLMMRWNYGFTEFYSEVYYKEDIAALINLIDFAEDKEITEKSKMILDLLFYDVATQSYKNMFVSVSGRAYEGNRKGPRSLRGLTEYYWGNGKEIGAGMMYGLMLTDKYELPPVIKEIALDSSNVVIKQSNGLDISELQVEGYYEKDTRSLMMQWGMEAFVNPSVVRNSLSHIRSNRMFSNDFLSEFKVLDFSILRFLHLEPFVVKLINPQYNGTAIQKGNTYTYKTKDYSLYTVQNYQVGDYADQHHISGMNIGNHFAIYHCHPAVEKDVKIHSPNYWVGYGHLPHSVQEKNVNLSIYNIPSKKGMMEKELLNYTHAYFPEEKFDTILLAGNYVFGKKGEAYCALIGTNGFKYREGTKDDIIQKGRITFWITEAGSKTQDGSFEDFVNRIRNNKIQFEENNLELYYYSNGNKYELKYNSNFNVNGKNINTNYHHFDSPYVKSERKAETLKINMNGKSLFLDFENLVREY
ncbi:hypothetical protein [Confluentibacter flavum]|uniref:hypothetical protein n=1 Tax=Confluentibacter flavum TaxID=1909700 RepID=UPI0012FEEC7C|nr:hypothetical protein [Confluentibacter flavum]